MPRAKAQSPSTSAPMVPTAARVSNSGELGGVIRKHRRGRGATLAEAAGLSGVGIRYLLELEHGKPTAALGKALQVLGRLGLDVWIVPRGRRVELRE